MTQTIAMIVASSVRSETGGKANNMTPEERIALLRKVLEYIQEVAEGEAEGGYGSDGQQGNLWNHVLVEVQRALAKDEGKAPW